MLRWSCLRWSSRRHTGGALADQHATIRWEFGLSDRDGALWYSHGGWDQIFQVSSAWRGAVVAEGWIREIKLIYRILFSFVLRLFFLFWFFKEQPALICWWYLRRDDDDSSQLLFLGIRFLHLVGNLWLLRVVFVSPCRLPFLVSIRAMDNKSVTLERDNRRPSV